MEKKPVFCGVYAIHFMNRMASILLLPRQSYGIVWNGRRCFIGRNQKCGLKCVVKDAKYIIVAFYV